MHQQALTAAANRVAGGHDIANRVIPSILRTPVLHRLLSDRLMLITFTGRKSGRQFTTPVTYFSTNTGVAFFSNGRWWINLRDGAPVTLRVRGRTISGMAEPSDDRAVVVREVRAYLDRHGMGAARRIGLDLPRGPAPAAGDLAFAAREHVIVHVTFDRS